jgi:hypothetical protein
MFSNALHRHWQILQRGVTIAELAGARTHLLEAPIGGDRRRPQHNSARGAMETYTRLQLHDLVWSGLVWTDARRRQETWAFR